MAVNPDLFFLKICINPISDSGCHCVLKIRIAHFQIVRFIGHKSHFHNSYRNGAPVDSSHIVGICYAAVFKSVCVTIGIQNALGKAAGIIIELGYIRIGRGGGNGKCTGSRGKLSTIGMDTHVNLCPLSGYIFSSLFITDGSIIIRSGKNSLIARSSRICCSFKETSRFS